MIHADLLKELGWSDDLIAEVNRQTPRIPDLPIGEVGIAVSEALSVGAVGATNTSTVGLSSVQAASAAQLKHQD